MESADTRDLKSLAARHAGSTPALGIRFLPAEISLEKCMLRSIPFILLLLGTAANPESLSPAEIDRRVGAWQPTAKERAFARIGWARDIRDAMRLSGKHNRPVFLFTHDGRLGIGRC